MLARKTPLFLVLGLLVPVAAVANGCTVKEVDTNNHVDTGAGVTTGAGGDGQGGSGTTTTGAGGDTTTTSTTTTATTGAGGASCVAPEGTGAPTKDDCATVGLELFPSTCGDSGDQPPPGKGVCGRGFEIYTTGAAEDLETCLDTIAANQPDVCDIDKVAACVTEMYDDACANDQADAACDGIQDTCAQVQDSIDVAACKGDLVPFGDAGLQQLADCFNSPDHSSQPCQQAYDECFDVVTSIQ